MADNTQTYGFRWIGSVDGGTDCPPIIKVRLASAYAPTVGGTGVNLHAGDPVQISSAGVGTICIGTEGTQSVIFGIIAGFSPEFDGSLMQPRDKHISGSGAYSTNLERQNFMHVIPAGGQIFEIDCNDNTTATTEAAYYAFIGENADMVLAADTTNAGDARCTSRLNISTHNTTSTLQWRILDIAPQINTDYTGNYVKLRVTGNKLQQTPWNLTGV